ncbi:hypothetical protein SAMN06297144_2156 [Sphingomonas guangdongensis]|uniref:Uncharacterized protein n=1 Tax=Sphingomonas guangdongensis TaxID=1141890 RepID=A0A285QYW7_9SPHN|nr:hypothetical protein [Sphingomonas guangdongensis]SOB87036.1 hypothetical protein SAMN06297144_2156 [Sphingomonas guangdongensis]
MTAETMMRGGRWRRAVWGAAVAVLLLPLVAMQFTRDVNWTPSDFVVAGVLLGAVLAGYEFLARRAGSAWYRVGSGVALFTGLFLTWVNLAVGIIGSENNDANMMYAGVLAVAVGGACLAHFRPRGMARAMLAAAAAQVIAGAIALALDLGVDGRAWPRDVIGATGIITGLWLIAATLFGIAARRP